MKFLLLAVVFLPVVGGYLLGWSVGRFKYLRETREREEEKKFVEAILKADQVGGGK